jgi:hypothetical protein
MIGRRTKIFGKDCPSATSPTINPTISEQGRTRAAEVNRNYTSITSYLDRRGRRKLLIRIVGRISCNLIKA